MKKKKRLLVLLTVLLLAASGCLGYLIYTDKQNNMTDPYYLASETQTVTAKDKEGNEISLTRGTQVDIKKKKRYNRRY